MNTDNYQKWVSQLRKGYLELCVMTLLTRKQSSYGFELLQLFTQAGVDLNEGTLYPLLNRMHKNGWLDSHWETPVDGGHPRRFYELSKFGESLLPDMKNTYTQQNNSLEKIGNIK